MKIILAGGGTGGHIFPLLVLAQAWQKKNFEILYSGPILPWEREILEKERIRYKKILSGKWRRWPSFWNIIDLFKIFIGFWQAFFIFLFNRPRFLFVKGGWGCIPSVFAAFVLAIPIFNHESDVVMGVANRFASRFARKVFLGFPQQFYINIPTNKAIYSGIPVREDFFTLSKETAKNKVGLTFDKPVLVIFGGSQGSKTINCFIKEELEKYLTNFQVVHVCGQGNSSQLFEVKNKLPNLAKDYHIFEFYQDMPSLLKAADIVVSRAGATSLAEIAAAGRAAIIIPFPWAAADHQRKNALIFQKANAAIILNEKDLTAEKFLSIIENLAKDQEKMKQFSNNVKTLATPFAAQKITGEIEGYFNERH